MTIPNPTPGDSFILPNQRLTDRQCSAIGRVAATWSLLEFIMEKTLAKLALAPSLLGYVLTDRLGPDNRISAIKSLVGVHRGKYAGQIVNPETLDAIDATLRSIERMKGDRNYAVHSVWANIDGELIHRIDIPAAARSGSDFGGGEPDRISDVEAFAGTVQAVADRLWQLSGLIPEIDPALLDKLRKQERLNRRVPDTQSTRLAQRRSYTRLQADYGPQEAASKKKPAAPKKSAAKKG